MRQTKRCHSCSIEKNITDFGRNKTRHDGLQAQCRTCKRAMQRNWYHKNKVRHVGNVTQRRRAEETRIIRLIIAYLHKYPCIDCGEDNPVVLEFDHVRGDKYESISNMISQGCSWMTIQIEIQKCEARCCNCHRIKTAKQFGYRKMLLASII